MQVHDLLKLYNEIDTPPERLLFKIPATWQVSILVELINVGDLNPFFSDSILEANFCFHLFLACH